MDLLARPDVTETATLAGRAVGLLAYHGGLEVGTLEVAVDAARRSECSLYALHQPEQLRWHVPSTRVDPAVAPHLAAVLGHVRVVMSIHGYGRRDRPWEILLGGGNRGLAAALAGELRLGLPDVAVTDDLAAIPAGLRGLHPANPVNHPAEGGVQIELPLRVRLSSDHRRRVAAAVAEVAGNWLTGHTSKVPPARQ